MIIRLIDLPDCLRRPLDEIAPMLSYTIGEEGVPVTVRQNTVGPKIIVDGDAVTVEYHKIPEFFRMLTMLPHRIGTNGIYEEHPAYEDLCLMSDCSRNAVYHLDAAKRMIRYLAMMGFTAFMLYTEDTYEIPEYPMFGYMRGRFTQEELRAIDDYAAMFGIEVIPCIQVLAHLEHIFKWAAFDSVKDDNETLLVGADESYQLIDAMLKACRSSFRTDRIHIGMDETITLGSGKYRKLHGERSRSDIFLEHLNRVVEMCKQHGYKPMMWSDMFFCNAFDEQYYVKDGEIPQDVIDLVPQEVSLVYWDYYTSDEETVRHMMHCHKQFNKPFYFAGGAWKWYSMTPRNYFSLGVNDVQLSIAREERLPMVIATVWGNGGSEASHFSVMPVLQQYAEYCYARGEDREWVKTRFEQTYHMQFDDFMLIDSPNLLSDAFRNARVNFGPKQFLYNDPLLGLMDPHVKDYYTQEFADFADKLAKVPNGQFSYLLLTTEKLCRVLSLKTTFSVDLRRAYANADRDTLRSIANERIPAIVDALAEYHEAVRDEWCRDNKLPGLEVIESRLGGMRQRMLTTQLIINRYLDGIIDRIDALEEQPLMTYEANEWLHFPRMFTAGLYTNQY